MEVGKLTVQRRSKTGKGVARRLRAAGLVPGICYGASLESPIEISLSPKALSGSLDPEKRQNTVIELTVEDNGTTTHTVTAMLRDYQIDTLRRVISHVDLIAIDSDKEIEADIPVKLTGRAKGLVEGGQLHTELHDVTVRCKPLDIPARVELDITELEVGDGLHVSDLVLPEGIELMTSPHLSIVSCVAPEVEEVAPEEELAEGVEGAEGAEGAAPAEGAASGEDAAAKGGEDKG